MLKTTNSFKTYFYKQGCLYVYSRHYSWNDYLKKGLGAIRDELDKDPVEIKKSVEEKLTDLNDKTDGALKEAADDFIPGFKLTRKIVKVIETSESNNSENDSEN